MPNETVAGVVLAGGRSTRMGGGDKCFKRLGSTTLLGHVMERFRPQVAALVLSANGDVGRFAGYGVEVVSDAVPDFAGPLAGILAGMDWARTRHGARWLVSTAADAPFLPRDLVDRLLRGRGSERIAIAASGGWRHPTTALWPVDLADELRRELLTGGRKVDRFTARYGVAPVVFAIETVDPFLNINTLEELAEAEVLLGRHRSPP